MKINRNLIVLHIILGIYSLGAVFSKMASYQNFMSEKFIIFYLVMLSILVLYAIAWQQIIKTMPLTLAYANKAISVVWGMLWGKLLFGESIAFKQMLGAIVVMIGIVLFAKSDGGTQ